ncbi:hypothetical protein QYF36_009344 [Acer negundo]|nr:hypothetical protein QYF36_009344 [Acer negundo]
MTKKLEDTKKIERETGGGACRCCCGLEVGADSACRGYKVAEGACPARNWRKMTIKLVIFNLLNETNNFPSPESDKDGQVEEDLKMPALETQDFDKAMSSSKDDEVGKVVGDSASTISDDILELVEERIGQLESEMISRRAEKKSRPSLKPLELAEELEKKQASTGLHWEEGAAAQPMRLEGVQRGSTTLGYFDVDASNTITQTIRSQAFRRDNGSPQVLAVHLNFIAVGMSKGVIVLVPSKYSAHHHDSLDSKVCADSVTLLSLVIVSYASH